MESVTSFLWQFISVGSVFSISMLVGHLTIQPRFNLWLRTALVATWLILLTVVGTGEIWIFNAAGLLFLWLVDFVYGKFTNSSGLASLIPSRSDISQSEPPAEQTNTISLTNRAIFSVVMTGLIFGCFLLVRHRPWCFPSRAQEVHLLLVSAVAVLGYVFQLKTFQAWPDSPSKAVAWFLPAAVIAFFISCAAAELPRVVVGHHYFLHGCITALCLLTIGSICFAQRGSGTAKSTLCVLVSIMVCVVFWHSYHMLQYRAIAEATSMETKDSADVEVQIASPNIEERFGVWQFLTSQLQISWQNPDPKEDQEVLLEKAEGIRQWEAAAAPVDYLGAAMENSFQEFEGWAFAARLLLGDTETRDNKKLVIEISNGRFLAVCRLERIRIAAKLAELQHGKKVRSLAELKELTGFETPIDPFGRGRLLSEDTSKGKWRVYSIGDDALDSGGSPYNSVGLFQADRLAVEKWIGDIVLTIE